MTRFVSGVLVLALVISAGCGAGNSEQRARSEQRWQWEQTPKSQLTYDEIRQLYGFLDDATFAEKWRQALQSPHMFLRSFVNSWYAEFAQVPGFGPLGVCFGDAHVENFGWLWYPQGWRFVFNDIDDTGRCPLALDALRYFTSVHLQEGDPLLVEELIARYLQAWDYANSNQLAKATAAGRQDPPATRAAILQKYVHNQRFQHKSLRAITPALQERLHQSFEQQYGLEVLDVVQKFKKGGGSAGLKRYWFLVVDDHHGGLDIVEWKQQGQPAVAFGPWRDSRPAEERLQAAAQHFWQAEHQPIHFQTVLFENAVYLGRSRTKIDVEIDALDAAQRQTLYADSVAYLGQNHSQQALDWDRQGFEDWLKQGVAIMTWHYQAAYAQAKAQNP